VGPLGELAALPQCPQLDLREPTSKGKGEREAKERGRRSVGEGVDIA